MIVRKTLRETLKRAYPATPASFDARMRNVLSALPPRAPRRALKPAVAILLAAVLVTCSLAYAAANPTFWSSCFTAARPRRRRNSS